MAWTKRVDFVTANGSTGYTRVLSFRSKMYTAKKIRRKLHKCMLYPKHFSFVSGDKRWMFDCETNMMLYIRSIT